MAKKRRRKRKWTSVAFQGKRKPAPKSVINSYPVLLTDEHDEFLLWSNGGVPVKKCFRMESPEIGETVGTVEFLYGAKTGNEDIAEGAQRMSDLAAQGAAMRQARDLIDPAKHSPEEINQNIAKQLQDIVTGFKVMTGHIERTSTEIQKEVQDFEQRTNERIDRTL